MGLMAQQGLSRAGAGASERGEARAILAAASLVVVSLIAGDGVRALRGRSCCG